MKMLIMALLLAAQGSGMTPAQTEAFTNASRAWAQCTKRYIDRSLRAPSPPGDEVLMDRAFAACPNQEAAVRAVAVEVIGEEQAGPLMVTLRRTNREAMAEYLGRVRPAGADMEE